jgi:hypothetical protein
MRRNDTLGCRVIVRADLPNALEDFDIGAILVRPAREPRTVCDAQPMVSTIAARWRRLTA